MLRYPGHVEKIELLKELGFFSEDPVMVQGVEVLPKSVSARVLDRNLTMPEVGDLLARALEVRELKGRTQSSRGQNQIYWRWI